MSPLAIQLVHGMLLLGQEIASFSGATLHVYLEDVGRVDAPSLTLAAVSIPNIRHQAGRESRLDFTLRGGPVDTAAHYSVRAHVDLASNGRLDPGDLITVQSYPVLTFGHPDRVVLRVKEIE
ncbi:YbaY family lipoprotein [Halomonas sp. BM-2019]|uniref:YbaY family lipoprotein n=1 Tax=Halomonas sp. BM-2019 TaxID=2811227 RepID=UPI001B3C3211|nr:MAG: YbaY family lipoprotein [Halomonas sp. BM-2019]